MSRGFPGVTLAVLMLLTTFGGAGAGAATTGTVTVSGRLEYVANLSAAHYEVADYALIYNDSVLLAKLTGKDVLVTGTVSLAPSIIMKKSLEVKQITLKSGDDTRVTIPVIQPAPSTPPGGGRRITIPVMRPVPIWRVPVKVRPV